MLPAHMERLFATTKGSVVGKNSDSQRVDFGRRRRGKPLVFSNLEPAVKRRGHIVKVLLLQVVGRTSDDGSCAYAVGISVESADHASMDMADEMESLYSLTP